MMNWDWNKMFTVDSFRDKYEFTPSIAGVCVWKACFGDGSDNIKGALQVKGLKKANDVKLAAFEYVKWLGEHPTTIKHIEDLKKVSHSDLFKIQNKTIEQDFLYQMGQFDPKYEVESTFFSNLRVIQSRCDDFVPFSKSKDVDEKYNLLIEKTLGFNVKEDRQFKFGMIKG